MAPQPLLEVEDPNFLARRVIRHQRTDETSAVRFNQPTDTVKGVADSNSTSSSVSSLSSSFENSHLALSTPFDTVVFQGLASWSDEQGKCEEEQGQSFSLHAKNEAEAQAIADKTLRAYAATALIDDTLDDTCSSQGYENKVQCSRRRPSNPTPQSSYITKGQKGSDQTALVTNVAIGVERKTSSLHKGLSKDVEGQKRLESRAGSTTVSMHQTITIVLLIVLFFGFAIHYGCWMVWVSSECAGVVLGKVSDD